MAGNLKMMELMGGIEVIGREVENHEQLRLVVKEGLPYRAVEALADALNVDVKIVTDVIAMPARTRSRRKGGRLTAVESDRVVRLARVAAHAIDVFEDDEKARQWLVRPNSALGGEAPMQMLDTDVGASDVDGVLTRIEYGVMS